MKIDESKIWYEAIPHGSKNFKIIAHLGGYSHKSTRDLTLEVGNADDLIVSVAQEARNCLVSLIKRLHRSMEERAAIAIGKLASFERSLV